MIRTGPHAQPFYEAKWRTADGQVKRRIGQAWLDPAVGGKGWVPRRGRVPEDFFDERRAIVRMATLIEEHRDETAREAELGAFWPTQGCGSARSSRCAGAMSISTAGA